jgi:hypothetical protein
MLLLTAPLLPNVDLIVLKPAFSFTRVQTNYKTWIGKNKYRGWKNLMQMTNCGYWGVT